MKKSELHKHIRETILSKLSEVATADDVDNQKAYNDELEKTKDHQKDLGIEEASKKKA